jgi:hypothetical protein
MSSTRLDRTAQWSQISGPFHAAPVSVFHAPRRKAVVQTSAKPKPSAERPLLSLAERKVGGSPPIADGRSWVVGHAWDRPLSYARWASQGRGVWLANYLARFFARYLVPPVAPEIGKATHRHGGRPEPGLGPEEPANFGANMVQSHRTVAHRWRARATSGTAYKSVANVISAMIATEMATIGVSKIILIVM